MPELPEVETMVRGIRAATENHRIESFERCSCTRKPMKLWPSVEEITRRVVSRRIESVQRIAKRILLQLDSGDSFVIEPRMTGLMLLAHPPTTEHLRLRWKLKSGRNSISLWFWDRRGLGTCQLMTASELHQKLGPSVLGPDALQMSAHLWQEQLSKTNRPLKVALLDQKLVAGIGNLYASEILFLARISPLITCQQLKPRQFRALADATREVLEQAIHYEGSTLADGTYRNALNQSGGYQNEHRVYAKAGELCTICQKEVIQRIVQAQRSTFYCPHCQKP